jgi:hypothetical protein
MAPVATMGGVLLQLLLPVFTPRNAVLGGVRPRRIVRSSLLSRRGEVTGSV